MDRGLCKEEDQSRSGPLDVGQTLWAAAPHDALRQYIKFALRLPPKNLGGIQEEVFRPLPPKRRHWLVTPTLNYWDGYSGWRRTGLITCEWTGGFKRNITCFVMVCGKRSAKLRAFEAAHNTAIRRTNYQPDYRFTDQDQSEAYLRFPVSL